MYLPPSVKSSFSIDVVLGMPDQSIYGEFLQIVGVNYLVFITLALIHAVARHTFETDTVCFLG